VKSIQVILLAVFLLPFNILIHAQEVEKGEVVVYTALDKQFSQPILADFEQETGIKVKAVYDTEAVKTVGLVNRLLAERHRPRADVFWNNEILRSIQLKNEGLAASYHSSSAESISTEMKDPEGFWTGFAARTRVILVNKDLLPEASTWPSTVQDLGKEKWKGKAAFAKPLFGTTNTHAAVIWAMAGEEKAKEFWNQAFANAIMVAGNAQARDAVVAGEVAWCLTDTDDAHGAMEDGANVALVYPKDDPAGPGTLVIPNTLVLIKNSPNQENAKKLIDYLLSKKVEGKLAASRSAQIPVRDDVPGPKALPPLPEKQILSVDWEKAYQAIAPSTTWLDQKIKEQ
jgi:iron(III) transport system substrate-binding protein